MKENESTESGDQRFSETIRQAGEIVEAYLREKGIEETFSKVDKIIGDGAFESTFEEIDEANMEFMKNYNEQARRIGLFLAIPLIEKIDTVQAKEKAGLADAADVFRVRKEVVAKTLEVAFKLAQDCEDFYSNHPETNMGHDPLEISIIFVSLMGKTFGDKDNLTGVGWMTFLDGLSGFGISLKDEISFAENYVKMVTC